jgi:hypothetical protein
VASIVKCGSGGVHIQLWLPLPRNALTSHSPRYLVFKIHHHRNIFISSTCHPSSLQPLHLEVHYSDLTIMDPPTTYPDLREHLSALVTSEPPIELDIRLVETFTAQLTGIYPLSPFSCIC